MISSKELSKFKTGSKEYKFFEKVFEKLGPNFVRKSVEEKQREVHSCLNKATERYFQSCIFADAVFKAVQQQENTQETSYESNSLNEDISNVHPVYFNMVAASLPAEESQDFKPFGLSKEKALQVYELQDFESRISELKKLVENNINEFCKDIIVCAGSSVFPGEKWQNEFDRTVKDLESTATLVSSKETREQTQKQLKEMTKTYYEELRKGLSLFKKALSLHEQKLEFESDLGEFYHHRCHAVCLKLRFCELKILQATYNNETLPALKKISLQMDQSEEKLKEKENEISVALESYQNLGEEYQHCVEEYTNLIKRIKEEQWVIDELESQKPKH